MARFQLEIPDKSLAEIADLMKQTGVTTKKEYVNSALTLLKWAIRQRMQGYTIAAVDEKNQVYRQIEMPIFDISPDISEGDEKVV